MINSVFIYREQNHNRSCEVVQNQTLNSDWYTAGINWRRQRLQSAAEFFKNPRNRLTWKPLSSLLSHWKEDSSAEDSAIQAFVTNCRRILEGTRLTTEMRVLLSCKNLVNVSNVPAAAHKLRLSSNRKRTVTFVQYTLTLRRQWLI